MILHQHASVTEYVLHSAQDGALFTDDVAELHRPQAREAHPERPAPADGSGPRTAPERCTGPHPPQSAHRAGWVSDISNRALLCASVQQMLARDEGAVGCRFFVHKRTYDSICNKSELFFQENE